MDTETIAVIAAGIALVVTVGYAILGVTGIKTLRGIRTELQQRNQRRGG